MTTQFPKSVAVAIGTLAFVAVFVLFGTIINARAATFGEDEGGQIFTHNGSLMRMVTLPYGRGIEIRYEEPRPGLQDVGVRQGTVLFRGNWRGNTLVGQALTFPNGCRSVPYEVKGYVGRYGEIVLEGMAPVVRPYSCVFVGWERNHNSYLHRSVSSGHRGHPAVNRWKLLPGSKAKRQGHTPAVCGVVQVALSPVR